MPESDLVRRLVETQTVSSLSRRIATKMRAASKPQDSLDLALASVYDHHAMWGADRAFVVKQEQALHAAIHAGKYSKAEFPSGHGSREEDIKLRESKTQWVNSHIQLGIPSYHASNSGRGFSRGPDGCFYSS